MRKHVVNNITPDMQQAIHDPAKLLVFAEGGGLAFVRNGRWMSVFHVQPGASLDEALPVLGTMMSEHAHHFGGELVSMTHPLSEPSPLSVLAARMLPIREMDEMSMVIFLSTWLADAYPMLALSDERQPWLDGIKGVTAHLLTAEPDKSGHEDFSKIVARVDLDGQPVFLVSAHVRDGFIQHVGKVVTLDRNHARLLSLRVFDNLRDEASKFSAHPPVLEESPDPMESLMALLNTDGLQPDSDVISVHGTT